MHAALKAVLDAMTNQQIRTTLMDNDRNADIRERDFSDDGLRPDGSGMAYTALDYRADLYAVAEQMDDDCELADWIIGR